MAPSLFSFGEYSFPDPRQADAEGLVAVGGEMSVERLALAYRSGIFPWTDRPVTWWSPDPRAIFELNPLLFSKSQERLLRQHSFRVSFDEAFSRVIRECSQLTSERDETWISSHFVRSYTEFHLAGYAHSVEVWLETELVGGIYGVAIGGFFAGESMFYRASNASKVGLLYLLRHLSQRGFLLFDTQVLNPFTEQMGALEIPREDYLQRLDLAICKPVTFL
ncbi:MAG: leucyl/phenylalanyl-tRNA--protein transferase [Verrucomicrobiota bacterium]